MSTNNAPRVTPLDIEKVIASEHYFTAQQGARQAFMDSVARDSERAPEEHYPFTPELGLLTFCVLVLENGFTVTGESACVSPENFDPVVGRQIARKNAVDKVWPLLGYELKTQLAAER